jgi:hypothetical protein
MKGMKKVVLMVDRLADPRVHPLDLKMAAQMAALLVNFLVVTLVAWLVVLSVL